MPTECERSVTSPTATVQADATQIKDNFMTLTNSNEDSTIQTIMDGDMSTSQTSTTSNGSSSCNGGRKASITSPDPTAYVAKARVTRPTPPPPPYNPMQFVQIKPCNLYQTAQEQLKKAEAVKKIKEIRKEEPEDWQNNLDNWKSSRRKRVEHIIDRVVEVKKLELEEHDRTRRKSKTFSEMIEERGERSGGRGLNKLASLAVYAEDEANDLSDLGIGTSSASGKSSLSEDYDNNSVMSDNVAELGKAITNSTRNKTATTESTTREYISSPGYETSSSTAPASSPDPCEYTYEGAIQDYKQRVSRAVSGLTSVTLNKLTNNQQQHNSKESTPERPLIKETAYPPRRGSKIEDRLMGFEVKSPSEECVEKNKVDVPKIDITKRKEIFESHETQNSESKSQLTGVGGINNTAAPRVSLRDRFKIQESSETFTEQPKKELKRLSGDITSIKERLQSLEQQQNLVNGASGATKTTANKLVDIPLKERLSSLQNAVTKEDIRKPPVVLVDARQLEIMMSEEEKVQQTLKKVQKNIYDKEIVKTDVELSHTEPPIMETNSDEPEEADKDDSGIHTADDVELEERIQVDMMKKEQELKLNAAIEALAKEEKQLSEAANVVNQIEAEFEELSLGSVALPPLGTNTNVTSSATPTTNEHMEYSVSSTNPLDSSTCRNNYNSKVDNSNSSIITNSGYGNSSNDTVKVLDFKEASNLRRKATNEMVHAKNLLKIFKETFQNDNELDEQAVGEKHEPKNIKANIIHKPETSTTSNIKTQIFENSNNQTDKIKTEDTSRYPQASFIKEANSVSLNNNPPSTASMIPRSMTPLGKPPMSPLTIRSTTKFASATPPGSPSLMRKADSQFSINGRVEIFNSKTMTTSPIGAIIVKPTSPTMTTKQTQLPHINTPKIIQSNDITFPNKQLPQEATAKQTHAVIEPLTATTTREIQQQQLQQQKQLQLQLQLQQQQQQKHQNEQLKTMPSQQMVNEPPMTNTVAGEIYHQQQPNHSSESSKQQLQREVILCAPPITIVNPDELPKPNTVKTLSSCFQQQQQKVSTPSKPIAPKPLLRSRIPQGTPPSSSPLLLRRHIFHSAETCTEEQNNCLSSISPTSPAEEKKLSTISSDSASSASTVSTVVDNSKKLSILSNTSSISGDDITPTLVKTSAQVHKEPTEETKESQDENKQGHNKTAKTLQALKETSVRELTPLQINMERNLETNAITLTAREIFLQSPSAKSPNNPFNSNLPFTTPLQSQKSPALKLFKTTTPLVVDRLYEKPMPLPPNNQRSPLALSKPTRSPATPHNVGTPVELPPLINCPPNESTLYKLAPLTPHSPVSPVSNLEKTLALDSAICNSLLTSLAAAAPDVLQRQHTVEEDLCHKVDKETLPFHRGSTGFKDVSKTDIKRCDGIMPSAARKLQNDTLTSKSVEEDSCDKIDINTLPDDQKYHPITGYKCVSPTEIRKCDRFFATGSEKPSSKHNSKPNSPISQAREAHSKALIETCEKIIAEERLASNHFKTSLPSSPVETPLIPRKSKIPKPISSCCKATESLNEADLKTVPPTQEDKNAAIARLHIVETQIKVTTSTPPASPKLTVKPQASPQPNKKTKNIFDFLKKNFGVGGHYHKEESAQDTPATNLDTNTVDHSQKNQVLVLSQEELESLDKVKYDEVHKFDNSQFYIPTDDSAPPPPLPKTPAPVNIEITRKITTDAIIEEGKTEKDLTREIDDLLDYELNKLNHEIDQLEKINEALELALAAIDEETIPQLQQQQPPLQPQPENLCLITAPSNNTNTIFSTTNSKNNHNNNKEITTEREVLKVELPLQTEQQQPLSEQQVFLINKTDEEKCEKLKLEENCCPTLVIQEKSEEEISKEPIYENINSTTSMAQVDVVLTEETTTPTPTATTTTTTITTYQQRQKDEEIIPRTMSKKQIDHFTTTNIDSKQNYNFQNIQTNNRNPNQNQMTLAASNQSKNSQINNFHSQISKKKNKNNSNNNIINTNNNNSSNKKVNTAINNVVDLTTNAFANTTTIATTPTTIASSNDLLSTTVHETVTSFKELNFHHLKQPSINSSQIIPATLNTTAIATMAAPATATATAPISIPISTNEIELNSFPESELIATTDSNFEPYYQVPKSSEPYYDAPKHLKPIPVYENIEIFFNGNLQPPKEKPPPPPADSPPLFDDVDSSSHTDTWSSDNTYETLTHHGDHHLHHHDMEHQISPDQPSPPIKRMNSTKRIKKELRNKRSSFLGIEGSSLDDEESYLELTVAPPPDMAQLLQEERRLEKQLYLKAGLCDSSDTGESRDSGVSENHSRQSSEHYTNSSEENEIHDDNTSPLTLQTQTNLESTTNDILYQNEGLLAVMSTPLLQTVKGNSAESWTESATVAAAATQSLTEATATANAKMMSIEEKIREQEEVLRVERELLQLEQEELKRQRENLMLRENMARRELQHGAKMLMSANRRSLQDLNGLSAMSLAANIGAEKSNNLEIFHQQINRVLPNPQLPQHIITEPQLLQSHQQHQQQQQQQQQTQQIYANIPNLQQPYYRTDNDYRKSMSDINEFSKRMMSQPQSQPQPQPQPPPPPPSKPMRAMHLNTNVTNGVLVNGEHADYNARQRHSLNSQNYGGSLVKIAAAAPTAAPRGGTQIYSNYHHQSVQNLSSTISNCSQAINSNNCSQPSLYPGNMSRNTLHALSATPKPKYTDGWVQVQQRKSFDTNFSNDTAWLSAYQQKRKSMPENYHGYNQNNHWLIQEAEQRRLCEQHQQQTQRKTISSNGTPLKAVNNKLLNGSTLLASSANGKPLPDSIIQTLTERVQSKGIGDRKRNNLDKSPVHAASSYHQQQYNKLNQQDSGSNVVTHHHNVSTTSAAINSSSSNSSQGQSNINTVHQQQQQQDKVLSVSGKKKCSHCGDELGRGAAMIIESLLLFYHINCFKCCVCHVQLGDGLNGTDVRVRNHKLHCQNCYSSDDGIKFSCV